MPTMPPPAPKAVAVEVVAARPSEADRATITHISNQERRPLRDEVYLVKIRLEALPPPAAIGWALYLKDYRVPKYWAYKHGVYFKVHDPQFLTEHEGQTLRFSTNGTDFVDTDLKLEKTKPVVEAAALGATPLPEQADALK
ncbi:MAG: hypothetical protein ACHRXM_07100 [Isosphaerales bacterium]